MRHMLKQEVEDKMRELIAPMEVTRILETGTGFGESAKFFSELKPKAKIYTVDSFGLYGDGRIYNEFNHEKVKAINQALGPNVIQILGDSGKIAWELPIQVLFLDADHTYYGCMADFRNYQKFVTSGGLIIFDDYTQENNPDNGVKQVVREIMEFFSNYSMIYIGYFCCVLKKI